MHNVDERAVEATAGCGPGDVATTRQALARGTGFIVIIAEAGDTRAALRGFADRGVFVFIVRFFLLPRTALAAALARLPVTLGLLPESSQKFFSACAVDSGAITSVARTA